MMVTGLFQDRSAAEQAVEELKDLGYKQNEISVMMNDKTRTKEFAEDTGSHAAKGAGVGAGLGGTLGAIVAGLAATGTVVATGGAAAPLIAGPLAAALAGAGAGGATGGLIGALAGAGLHCVRAKQYEAGLQKGGIVGTGDARPGDESQVREILRDESSTGDDEYSRAGQTYSGSDFSGSDALRNTTSSTNR